MESMKLLYCCLLSGLIVLPAPRTEAQPQQLPMFEQSLDNMADFLPVASNWSIVGDVSADRHTEHQISTSAGSGILVNIPTERARENLFFGWEHGDIELELEFMIPKGSNAGIYLQGRYEIQIFDSWGVSRPTFSDAGGIYQRWDPDRPDGQQGFQGHPPQMNVSRAPGLWQQFQIRFQAPRFDDEGRKIANARMVKVVHNGVVIHENVELTGPTRSAAFSDEQAMGPLMIQGDHGPVAVRHIRYKLYQPNLMRLTEMHYQYAEGVFDALPDMATLTPRKEGAVDGIDWRVSGVNDQFVMRFTGNIHVPYTALYRFQLQLDWITGDPHFQNAAIGAGALMIGDETVINHAGKVQEAAGEVELEAGTYPFELSFYKNRAGPPPRMALYVEGGGLPLQSLNAPGSLPAPPQVGSIFVESTGEPALIRGFVMHNGKKKTHAIAVGHESGVHYTMDLQRGALLHVWKGAFIETTDMWHSRGQDQLAVPRGSVLTFSGAPTVAHLASAEAAWPDTAWPDTAGPGSTGDDYTFEGYELDAEGHPSFLYRLGDIAVSDRLLPEQGGRQLLRELTLRGTAEGYWVRVADGVDISKLDDGSYSVDDRMYYVMLHESGGAQAVIRTSGGRQELLIPISFRDGQATVRYALIW